MRNQLCIRPTCLGMMMILFLLQILPPIQTLAQSGAMKVRATGTGNTTGHIANLSVTNSTGANVKINPQTCYIPSDGQYQPYIATIPGTTVPPGTTTILIDGYCADVHTPPVPGGDPMPPIEEWIPVGNPGTTTQDGGINLLPAPVLPTYLPKDIPNLIQTPGYTSVPSDPETDIIITWPGTDIPVGGIIDPVNFPERFAPMLIDALDKIEEAFDKSKGEGIIVTPISGDPERERESVIQQTLWIYVAGITGERYQEEHFHTKVVEQFEKISGTTLEALPKEDKEKLDSGIDEFWNTFTAIGKEAKVLSKAESTTITPAIIDLNQTEPNPNDPSLISEEGKEEAVCACDSMEIHFSLNIENKAGNMISEYEANQTAIFGKTIEVGLPKKITASASNVAEGKKVELTVTPILKCDCSEKDGECPAKSGTIELLIEHGNEKLDEKFGLGKVPYEIDVTVTQTCGSADCKEITCTATISIIIKKETDKQKTDREKKEKEKAEKAEKEKEKKEKEKKG